MNRNIIRLIVVGLLAITALSGCSKKDELDFSTHDERVVQKATCINNLKQIGIVFRIWEGDHGDQFPFNTSTNAGGTLELCAPDKDGFDRNAYLYLKTMTNSEELTKTLLLVCPQDPSKRPASSWETLQATNITYRFRCGTNTTDSNPKAILAVCPIDGNVLYADGTVVPGTEAGRKEMENQMHLPPGK